MWDSIFDILHLKELLVILQTCKWLQKTLQRYWAKVFNFSTLLHPFLTLESIGSFRRLLQTSGGIISGSTALQFLDRRAFNTSSDLDLYVHRQQSPIVQAWFQTQGFSEVSPEHALVDAGAHYRQSNEIVSVVNLKLDVSSRIIQLISTKRDPIFAVLSFHSSMLLSCYLSCC